MSLIVRKADKAVAAALKALGAKTRKSYTQRDVFKSKVVGSECGCDGSHAIKVVLKPEHDYATVVIGVCEKCGDDKLAASAAVASTAGTVKDDKK